MNQQTVIDVIAHEASSAGFDPPHIGEPDQEGRRFISVDRTDGYRVVYVVASDGGVEHSAVVSK